MTDTFRTPDRNVQALRDRIAELEAEIRNLTSDTIFIKGAEVLVSEIVARKLVKLQTKLKRRKLWIDGATDRIAELEAKLKRLGSSEAFDVARSIDKERDAELIARMDYANEALGEKV